MTQEKPPAISFHDLTLGYDRHPAVHHITGEVARGDLLALVGPNGAGKSTLLKGIMGQLKPLAGSLSLDGLKRQRHRLSAATDRHRPQLPDHCVRLRCHGAVARDRHLARPRPRAQSGGAGGARTRSACTTSAIVASARFRADSSSASCSRACSCRTRPSSCSTSRSAPSTPRRSTICFASSAAGTSEGRTVIAALHDLDQVRAHFPKTLLLAREVVAWGPTKQVLTAEEPRSRRGSSPRPGTRMRKFASAARHAGERMSA